MTSHGARPGPSIERLLGSAALPHPWLLAPLELGRAGFELTGSLVTAPLLVALHRAAGSGGMTGSEGPAPARVRLPVLVIPGLGGANGWTKPLRAYLSALGHDARAPRAGTMLARGGRVVTSLLDQVIELADETGDRITLLAWSVGGCFARRAALRRPDLIRRVITLGTPLDGPLWFDTEPEAGGDLGVPVTAIYSRTDGIFDWRRCLQPVAGHTENVEVVSSHFGMSTNPMTWQVVGARLARA